MKIKCNSCKQEKDERQFAKITSIGGDECRAKTCFKCIAAKTKERKKNYLEYKDAMPI